MPTARQRSRAPSDLYGDPAYYAAVYEETILSNPYIPKRPPWNAPHPPQALFLLLPVPEALYGGAAGSGKSDSLLMGAAQYQSSDYHALLLRRTYRDLALPGAIMHRAHQWWDGTDARWLEKDHKWVFPKGNTITFGYLEHDSDVYSYQSAEFQYIAFDELTQFLEFQYTFLFSRLRKLVGSIIPLRMRAASNPGNRGHAWVKEHFLKLGITIDYHGGIDQRSVKRAIQAFQHYQDMEPEDDRYSVLTDELEGQRQAREARERTAKRSLPDDAIPSLMEDDNAGRLVVPPVFVPAKLDDNPAVDRRSYLLMLSKLDPVTRAQLRNGDWEVSPGQGVYDLNWFEVLDDLLIPNEIWEALQGKWTGAHLVRSWDLAGSEQPHSDFTVGTLVAVFKHIYYILDVVRMQGRPERVKSLLLNTAQQDGKAVAIYVEREGGSGGAITADTIKREWLSDYEVWTPFPGTNKLTRAKVCIPIAAEGRVKLRRGNWNLAWNEEMALWPYVVHDDQGDSFHSGVNALNSPEQRRWDLLARHMQLPMDAGLTEPSVWRNPATTRPKRPAA